MPQSVATEAIPLHDKDRYSTLTFVGGFDRKKIVTTKTPPFSHWLIP